MKNKFPYLNRGIRIFLILAMVLIVLSIPSNSFASNPVKVGLVVDGAGIDDNGWNEMAYEGVLRAHTDFGITYAVYTGDDYKARLKSCVAGGNDLCIATSWLFYDAVLVVAANNPTVDFALIDTEFPDDAPGNLRGVGFEEDEVGYLAGTLAGLMTTSDIIGAVGGMDIRPVVDFLVGYQHGAQCANDNVYVISQYTQTFVDPDLGAAVAAEMISKGADVIFGAAGPTGNGAILYSAGHGVWSIGVDTDQYETVFDNGAVDGAEKLLTSAMKKVDNAVYMTIEDFINLGGGTFGGNIYYNLASGAVGLADYHEAAISIPQAVKDQVEAVEDGIINNTIFVDDPCAISIWHSYWPGSPHETVLAQNIADIRAADPSLPRFITTFQPDIMMFDQAVRNGWGPDFFIGSNDLITTLVNSEILMQLDSWVSGELSNYESYALDGMIVNDKLYGLPLASVAVGLYYNKSTITTPPATVGELHGALTFDGKSFTAPGVGVGSYYFYGLWNAFGGQLVSPDLLCVADQGGVTDAVTYLLDLQGTGNAYLQADYAAANTAFRTGEKDMLINGPWVLQELKEALGSNLGVAPLPEGPAGAPSIPMTGLEGIYINNNLPSPPEVLQLLVDVALALTNQSSSQRMMDDALTIPVRTDVTFSDPLMEEFASIAESGDPTPRPMAIDHYWEPFNNGIQQILEGSTSARRGIKSACDSMNDLNGFPSISGSTGMEGADSLITYDGGWTDWDYAGKYIFYVPFGWSGTITPARSGIVFMPYSISLTDVQADQIKKNFTRKMTTAKVTFNWEDVAGATNYKVQLSTSSGFTTPIFTITTTASEYFYPTKLEYNKLYYWRIKAKIGGVWQAWSPTWRFKSMDQLTAPTLLSPTTGWVFTGTHTPVFTWAPVENAAYYKIQISTSNLFETKVQKATVLAGEVPVAFTANTLVNGRYYWRVRAYDETDVGGPWSLVWMFKVKVP